MKQEIAQRLTDRRKQAGLSQEALAEKLGVSRQAVSKWECSECSPDTDNLIALAQLYGVSLDDLLWKDVEDAAEDGGSRTCDGESCADGDDATAQDALASDPGSAPDPVADGCGEAFAEAAAASCAAEAQAAAEDDADAEAAATDAAGGEAAAAADSPKRARPAGGESVHVSWRDGIHVVDPAKGEEVHVGWDGVHVHSSGASAGAAASGDWFAAGDGKGHTFSTDGTAVVVDGTRYDSWRDAHRAYHHPHRHRSDGERPWRRFPFPLLVIVAYIFTGVFTGLWGPALFLVFLIPLYYLVGNLLETREIAHFIEAIYPIGSLAFFCYMALVENSPHPAWVVFLTIPLVECACIACSHWWEKRRRARA